MSRPQSVNKAGKPKFSYFDLNARGALARLIFAVAGKQPTADYIDERIDVNFFFKLKKSRDINWLIVYICF